MIESEHSGPKLSQVHCGPRVQTLFIVVPGTGTLAPEKWSDGTGDFWLRSIKPPAAYDAGIFSFDNLLAGPDRPFSWWQVQSQGADFLAALYSLTQIEGLSRCPIVLLCHSLGGVILKRALSLAHRQPRFRTLLANIAGIIALASPHAQLEASPAWENVAFILAAYAKPKSKHVLTQGTRSELAEDCLVFERVVDQIPLLTIFETVESRIKGLFGPKIVLVGKQFAATNTNLESLHGIERDHNNICCFRSDGQELNIVSNFINEATSSRRGVINKRSEEYVRPPALGQSTIRSQSSEESLNDRVGNLEMTGTPSSAISLSIPATTGEGTAGSTAASFQMIPSLTDFSIEKTDPKLPCVVMPLSRNRHFFGRRAVIDTLRKAFFPKVESTHFGEPVLDLKTSALCGPGGMGKTQIAVEFLYRHKADFDAIFWVNADEPSKLAQNFKHIAITLGLIAEDSMEASDLILTRDLVLGWLSKPLKSYRQLEKTVEEASWLLVFDNADDLSYLSDFWPSDSTGCVLITSRDPLARSSTYSPGGGMNLAPFDIEEATEFLLHMTGRSTESKEIQSGGAVAETLGGLPLAITQMAGLIQRRDLSFHEFLDLYRVEDERVKLLNLQLDNRQTRLGYDHTIASVWALDTLKEGGILLEILSLLDPDAIPEYILVNNEGTRNLVEYPQTSSSYQDARSELHKASLIARERDTETIVIHRLIQDTARARMSDGRFNKLYSFLFGLVSSVWPYEDFGFGNELYRWAKCDELYPHVLRLQKLYPRFRPPTELVSLHLEAPKLLLDAAWFRIMRGDDYLEAIPFLDMGEALCASLSSGRERDENSNEELHYQLKNLSRMFHHHRGVIGLHINTPKVSLSQFQIFTDMLISQFGDTHEGGTDQSLGVAWNELGNAFLQNGMWDQAEEAFMKSINALKGLEGATKISISMPLINLAFNHWLQGRLDEAAADFEEALEDREIEYGIDDKTSFVTGKLLLGFGNVRAEQGRLEESFQFHQRCLQQFKSTIGNNHHKTGDACVKVSDHYVRLSQHSAALALLDQALKTYGDRPHFAPERARACYKRGNLLKTMKRNQEAETELKNSMALYRKMHPTDFRPLRKLESEDFDRSIMFWSR